jgi:predicted lipid-binding transport protein (Tim44 family)
MSYCPKCGTKVSEEMVFCPKCGAPLKAEKPPTEAPPTHYRSEKAEKAEKYEKQEKGEKTEKHEKQEFGFVGPLIGGLILIFFGLMSYLQVTGFIGKEVVGALFLILIGIIIIVGVIYATRRHPRP